MSMPARLASFVVASTAAIATTAAQQPPPKVNPVGAAVLAFQERLADYVKVRKQGEAKVPDLAETSDPARIARNQAALGEAIRQLRASAKPGDIFAADVRAVLVKAILEDFAHRTATDRKALAEDFPAKTALTVNMTYPPTLPLGTVPAKLLRALPDLPPDLEYRIVGRHLILRDVNANIVVDFIRDVVPTIPS